MRTAKYCTTVLVLIFFFVLPSHAQEITAGKIDWIKGYIIGYGHGTADPGMNKAMAQLSAFEVAKIDAMKNLLEVVRGVRIDAQTRVEDFMVKESVINAQVSGVIMGARIIKTETKWIEGVPLTTVGMRLCMSAEGEGCSPVNSLTGALDLTKLNESDRIPSADYAGSVFGSGNQEKAPPDEIYYKYDSTKSVTGVIFSLQGLRYQREILPVVAVKKDDKVLHVYSVKLVKPKIVRTYGIVRYADTLDHAGKIEKIGDNVLIVPVQAISENKTLVINSIGARLIYDTTRQGNDYLSKAKVVISAE